ncbi:MAG: PIN domain-containing protein [Pseudomonadota bacterium]
MTAACFVDANVLVYACDPADARKFEVATNLIGRLWREQSGRISTQVLNEFYTVITRKVAKPVEREKAWHDVEELFEWNPMPIDAALLHGARSIEVRYKLSWWDSLIVAAAQLQGCSILYTEDLQNGAVFGNVRVRNPFIDQVQEEPPVPYAPKVVSRHRPRGRPRKAA